MLLSPKDLNIYCMVLVSDYSRPPIQITLLTTDTNSLCIGLFLPLSLSLGYDVFGGYLPLFPVYNIAKTGSLPGAWGKQYLFLLLMFHYSVCGSDDAASGSLDQFP